MENNTRTEASLTLERILIKSITELFARAKVSIPSQREVANAVCDAYSFTGNS